MPHLFNSAANEIPEALSIRFNQMVYDLKRAGRDVIVLSLGEAFFDIPLFDFRELDYSKGFHYSDSQGLPSLREKIATYYTCHYDVPVDPDREILISAGSKPLIYMSILAVVERGDEVVVHEPSWLSYPEQARLCGARTRYIPSTVDVDRFKRYLTRRTRMVILNNPNNPAGRIYTREELTTLHNLCEARGIYLLVDEAYSDFVVDEPFVSIGALVPGKDRVVILNSLSKNMGMSGWRLGYVIAHPEVIQVLLKINQHIITCPATILSLYCDRYFDDILACTLPQVRAVVEKRRRVGRMLEELGLSCLPGGATFYYFVSLGNYPGTSLDFGTALLREHQVAVVPGQAYGKSTDRYIRVAVGTESDERIYRGLRAIRTLLCRTQASGAVFTTEQE